MNPAFSGFLDLLRILAAGAVFASHAAIYGAGPRSALQAWAHDGVIAFFVLSGYLITWSALERDRCLSGFVYARAGRIYSVALPALLITLALDFAGQAMRPDLYAQYQYDRPILYFAFFLAFASDLWFLSETAFSNVPFWSLCYEVWYYALFGVLAFCAGWARWALALVILLVMGPKLWLLLPLWALGSWLCLQHRRTQLAPTHARALLLLATTSFAALKLSGLDGVVDAWVAAALDGFPGRHLRYSQWFAGDYLVGGTIALAIFSARDADLGWLSRPRLKRALSAAASCTFTLYLLHFPLLLFFSVLFRHERGDSPLSLAAMVAATLAFVVAVAPFTEHRKDVFRRAIQAALSPIATRPGAPGE